MAVSDLQRRHLNLGLNEGRHISCKTDTKCAVRVLPNRFRNALRSEPTNGSQRKKGYLIVVGVAALVVLALLIFEVGPLFSPSRAGTETATTATYNIAATSVLASASKQAPSGYAVASSRPLYMSEPGLENA
jgi:hypothetical protein